MIDFKNSGFFKLKQANPQAILPSIQPLLLPDESLISAFQSVRDFVAFTTKRIISVNVQGLSGKKKDFTSMPYSRIQVFSVETSGPLDRDCELDLWFSGIGNVRFEFSGGVNIAAIAQTIGSFALK